MLAALGRGDGVLLLSAPPGGGPFDPSVLDRLRTLPPGLPTTVDGSLEPPHFGALKAAGVGIAVTGRSLFSAPDLAGRASALQALAR